MMPLEWWYDNPHGIMTFHQWIVLVASLITSDKIFEKIWIFDYLDYILLIVSGNFQSTKLAENLCWG